MSKRKDSKLQNKNVKIKDLVKGEGLRTEFVYAPTKNDFPPVGSDGLPDHLREMLKKRKGYSIDTVTSDDIFGFNKDIPKVSKSSLATVRETPGLDLSREAKKHATVKGFIASQPELLHGTDKKFDKFDLSKMEGNVAYFTDSAKDFAEGNASGAVGTSNIIRRHLKPGLKLGGYDEADKWSTDQLIQEGYHGLKLPQGNGSTWYEIFDPNKDLLTKQELEEIYNKAHKKSVLPKLK